MNLDDTPITSCGRYVIPPDQVHAPPPPPPPATYPGPSLQAPADSSEGGAPPPVNTCPPGLERRHRSPSRRRLAAATGNVTTGRAESAENALRRSKPPEGSSESEAAHRNKPKKWRKGSIGDGPPAPPADQAT
ncbi:hypothetical protein MTO96_041508 [Rhipicephalus appendiculatus]